MKLSEAIRLGAMLHPQCFHGCYELDDGGTIVASCALGAAQQAGYARLSALMVIRPRVCCPQSGCIAVMSLGVLVTHLNDQHHWTRERIADFVATVESAECGPTPAVAAVDPSEVSNTGKLSTRAAESSFSSSSCVNSS